MPLEQDLVDLLGFRLINGVLRCLDCGIVFSESNNPFTHRVGCRWVRAIYALLIGNGEVKENPYLS